MAVKNPTQWTAPSGTGYFTASGGAGIVTLSNSQLTTLSGSSINTDTAVYAPMSQTAWTVSAKNKAQWSPLSGSGYTVTVGTELFATNSGNLLITNSANNLVTTATYNVPKYKTSWTATGV